MKKKIFLLTGFLGSGKTTFLQNLLTQIAATHKIGVIVNEFGRAGIDGSLIARDGLELHELSGGSIFCACLKSNFVAALDVFLDLPLDYLFIESSGLADPAGFHKISSFIDKNDCIDTITVLCVVDGKYFLDQLDMFNSVETQICAADMVLVNKIDLISGELLAQIDAAIVQLNATAKIVHSSFGSLNLAEFEEIRYLHPKLSVNEHPAFRPFTHTLITQNNLSREQLHNFLAEITPLALRIKGFLLIDSGCVKIDVVGKTINIVKYDLPVEPKLEIIATQSLPINREIKAAWQKHCAGEIILC
ncbi:MAG: GTP-binding protein [Negativicutes bacterium]